MKNMSSRFDLLRFWRSWLANPLRVAAVAPSGKALARLITRELLPGTGPVLELGPGTGVFTQALIRRGIPEKDLILVELGEEFARLLNIRFPEAKVLQADAVSLRHALTGLAIPVAGVVSGLPLLSMRPEQIASILSGAFGYLRPGGAFYQFTYGPRCPVPSTMLEQLGLEATRVGRALLNIPPAAVYRIVRRSP